MVEYNYSLPMGSVSPVMPTIPANHIHRITAIGFFRDVACALGEHVNLYDARYLIDKNFTDVRSISAQEFRHFIAGYIRKVMKEKGMRVTP